MKNETIDILLASFNGASFIADQLDSILTQDYEKIYVIVRDDLSTDGTTKILETYVNKYPEKITRLPSEKRLGVRSNFSRLMEHSTADYIMFADQDDIWEKGKIRQTLDRMKELERNSSPNTPLLVHTDLKVVDSDLNLLSSSFWQYSGIDPLNASTLNRLLMQNTVTGCTVMINRHLLIQASPIPEGCAMHDCWLALVAAASGKIDSMPQATMLYRQHGKNALGAKKFLSIDYFKQGIAKIRSSDTAKQVQAKELLARYSNRLNENQKQMLLAFQELPHASFVKKMSLIFKYQFFKSGFVRNAANIFLKKY